MKALLIHYNVNFPKIHDIADLLKLLKKNTGIEIPENIQRATDLTPYSVMTRYPHWNIISDNDYNEALEIAEEVYKWASQQI